jgi:CHASE3 domain sensor protein
MIRSRSFGFKIALGFTASLVMLIVIGTIGYLGIAKTVEQHT